MPGRSLPTLLRVHLIQARHLVGRGELPGPRTSSLPTRKTALQLKNGELGGLRSILFNSLVSISLSVIPSLWSTLVNVITVSSELRAIRNRLLLGVQHQTPLIPQLTTLSEGFFLVKLLAPGLS